MKLSEKLVEAIEKANSSNLGFQIVQTRGELIGNFTCARRERKLRDSLFIRHISSFISVR